MRIERLVPVLAVLVAAAACGSERASGELLGPLAGPRVAGSELCLAVVDGRPVAITDLFERSDDVHLWVHWENLEPPHAVEAVWFNPSGSEVESTIIDIPAGPSERVTVFRLELAPGSALGRWQVELHLDGDFMRSHAFDVVPSP